VAELLVVLGVMIFGVNQGTLRQIITADAFQGRTNATFGVVLGGCTATGALAGGACAELVGIPALLLVAQRPPSAAVCGSCAHTCGSWNRPTTTRTQPVSQSVTVGGLDPD